MTSHETPQPNRTGPAPTPGAPVRPPPVARYPSLAAYCDDEVVPPRYPSLAAYCDDEAEPPRYNNLTAADHYPDELPRYRSIGATDA